MRRLLLEPLEERALLSAAPLLVDLQADSDSGLYDDDNLTNVSTPTIDIMSAQPGDTIFVYRNGLWLGLARQIDGALYQYTILPGQLQEGENSVTARCFDGFEESGDSPTLVIKLDTVGPRVIATGPGALVDAATDSLDSVTVTFDEAITVGSAGADSFWLDDIDINGPDGQVAPAGINKLTGNQYEITFAPQTRRGSYVVSVGPGISDSAGNLMDQDRDGQRGETGDDISRFGANVIDADIVFTSSTLIAADNTTYDGQDILVNSATLTIDGTHTFNSVHLVNGAVLTYSGGAAADNAFGLYTDQSLATPGLTGSYIDESL